MRIQFSIRTGLYLTLAVAILLAATVRLKQNQRFFVQSIEESEKGKQCQLLMDLQLASKRYLVKSPEVHQIQITTESPTLANILLFRRNYSIAFTTLEIQGNKSSYFNNTAKYTVGLNGAELTDSAEALKMTMTD